MRQAIFLILFLPVCIHIHAQYKIPKLENISFKKIYIEDSLLTELKKESRVLIMFRSYSVWTTYSDYCILNLGKDNSLHYHILITNPEIKGLYYVKKAKALLDSIWTTCIQNDLFKIKTEDRTQNKCGMIYDSHYYEFFIFIKNERKQITYYAPDYFEKECPGNKARIDIINCANFFRKNNKLQ